MKAELFKRTATTLKKTTQNPRFKIEFTVAKSKKMNEKIYHKKKIPKSSIAFDTKMENYYHRRRERSRVYH